MKHPNKKLLDDLIEDSVSSDYRSETMNQTLRSARRRKRIRQLGAGVGAAALAGFLLLASRKMPQSAISQNRVPQTLAATSQPRSVQPQAASTTHDPILAIVQTTESARPKEISDQELASLLSGQRVGLVRYESGRTELIR